MLCCSFLCQWIQRNGTKGRGRRTSLTNRRQWHTFPYANPVVINLNIPQPDPNYGTFPMPSLFVCGCGFIQQITVQRRRLRQYQLGTARPKRIRPLETGLQLFPKRFRGATLNRFNLCVSSSKNLLAHTLREREARRRTLKPTEFIYTVCRNAAEKTIVQYTCESPRNGSSSVRGVLFCLQNIWAQLAIDWFSPHLV